MASVEEADDAVIANATRGMSNESVMKFKVEYFAKRRNPWIVLLLILFIGGLGIHHFYLGKPAKGAMYITAYVLLQILARVSTNHGLLIFVLIMAIVFVIFVFTDLFTFIKISKERNEVIASEIASSINGVFEIDQERNIWKH